MHKAIFLEGELQLTITTNGPLLIKSGESSSVEPARPDMQFVRSQNRVFIPGSSLKGVVRAQAERICRAMDSAEAQQAKLARRQRLDTADLAAHEARSSQERKSLAPISIVADARVPLADNPLGTGDVYSGLDDTNYSSGRAIKEMKLLNDHEGHTPIIYRRSSFASQLFGHTGLAGRVRFADAYTQGEVKIEERNGVAIDRIYGSVAVGPFNYETVVDATFTTAVSFKNITLAQLALLGLSLRDLAEGRTGIGFGKSRGLGRVKVTFDAITLRYPTCELQDDGTLTIFGRTEYLPKGKLLGLGALVDSSYDSYDLPKDDTGDLASGLAYVEDDWFGVKLEVIGDMQVRGIWKACMPAWKRELGL